MNILIIDDDKIITYALKTILESEGDINVVGTGYSKEDAIKLYNQYKPDIMLLDIRMGESTGIDALQEIIESHPEAKIIFLTTFLDDEYIIKAIALGAKGYLLKSEFENIIPAIRSVQAGQIVYESKVAEKIPTLIVSKTSEKIDVEMTDRELELMKLISEGYNNKEISGKLFLSEGTVRNYISIILDKLELRDRTQLAVYYIKNFSKA